MVPKQGFLEKTLATRKQNIWPEQNDWKATGSVVYLSGTWATQKLTFSFHEYDIKIFTYVFNTVGCSFSQWTLSGTFEKSKLSSIVVHMYVEIFDRAFSDDAILAAGYHFINNSTHVYAKHVTRSEMVSMKPTKTNKNACAPSEGSDQPGHPPSIADAQADLSLRLTHSYFVGCPSWLQRSTSRTENRTQKPKCRLNRKLNMWILSFLLSLITFCIILYIDHYFSIIFITPQEFLTVSYEILQISVQSFMFC